MLKGNSQPKNKCGLYDRTSPEIFLVYHSPIFEAWKAPKKPVEVSCDVTQHLVACRTAVDTRTNSSGMRTQTTLTVSPHAYTNFALLVVRSVQKSYRS